ncbi:MAG: hypothetical protein MUF72_10670 [Elainella sp. Prado103]|nr:hypothetical protein [Elainella sp. Prado103]
MHQNKREHQKGGVKRSITHRLTSFNSLPRRWGSQAGRFELLNLTRLGCSRIRQADIKPA